MEEPSVGFFSSVRRLLMVALIVSCITIGILISITEVVYPRPNLQPKNGERSFPDWPYSNQRGPKEMKSSFNLSSAKITHHDQPKCSILVVVKGYFLYFRKVTPKNRTFWCSFVNCTVSLVYSNNISDVLASNITLFSHLTRLPSAKKLRYLLQNRRQEQRWALMSRETPLRVARNTSLPVSISKTFFHWLATYSPTSEVPITYGQFVPVRDGLRPERINHFELKSKEVAFVSSNCIHSKWQRLDFVKALQRYLPIDIYGNCGNLTCDRNGNCTDILRQYKFILALENSPCPGYITEKFWNAVDKFQSVAVVWGASKKDYEQNAPPQSFILVEAFQSMKSLASYIRGVSNNQTLYNSYHDWRLNYRVIPQDDEEALPNNEQLCRAADLYINETTGLLSNDGGVKYKNINGKDWIQSCRIPVHTKMAEFPIPEE